MILVHLEFFVVLQFGFIVDFSTGALHSSKENLPSTLVSMAYLA